MIKLLVRQEDMRRKVARIEQKRGAVLIEALIVLGLLLFFLAALFDLFFMSGLYINLSQFAREGVLNATAMHQDFGKQDVTLTVLAPCKNGADLERSYTDLQAGDSRYVECQGVGAPAPLTDPTCGHFIVQWRVERLFDTLSSAVIDPATTHVTTTCASASITSFQVNVEAKYRGYSPIFRNSIVRAQQIGLVRGKTW